MATDHELVERARAGDREAFDELDRRHRPYCLRLARHYGHPQDAEDRVQEMFLLLYEHLDEWRGEGEFTAWLHRIVQNQCRSAHRREQALRRWGMEVDLPVHLPCPPSVLFPESIITRLQSAEASIYSRQISAILEREITLLPRLLRAAVMAYSQGSFSSFSQLNHCTIAAARTRLNRGRGELVRRMRVRLAL